MSEQIKLLPCPFCGSSAEIERHGDRTRSTIYTCDSCGCTLETGEEWDHGRRWNIRADTTLRAENEMLRAALSQIDKLAVGHVTGAIGKAQKIARAALAQTGERG